MGKSALVPSTTTSALPSAVPEVLVKIRRYLPLSPRSTLRTVRTVLRSYLSIVVLNYMITKQIVDAFCYGTAKVLKSPLVREWVLLQLGLVSFPNHFWFRFTAKLDVVGNYLTLLDHNVDQIVANNVRLDYNSQKYATSICRTCILI